MTQQKIIITSDSSKVNELIDKGWIVKTIVAQHVATGFNYSHRELSGSFCFLLEKESE